MERTVPSTESEEIELYQRTYYSLLRTTDEGDEFLARFKELKDAQKLIAKLSSAQSSA